MWKGDHRPQQTIAHLCSGTWIRNFFQNDTTVSDINILDVNIWYCCQKPELRDAISCLFRLVVEIPRNETFRWSNQIGKFYWMSHSWGFKLVWKRGHLQTTPNICAEVKKLLFKLRYASVDKQGQKFSHLTNLTVLNTKHWVSVLFLVYHSCGYLSPA